MLQQWMLQRTRLEINYARSGGETAILMAARIDRLTQSQCRLRGAGAQIYFPIKGAAFECRPTLRILSTSGDVDEPVTLHVHLKSGDLLFIMESTSPDSELDGLSSVGNHCLT